MCGFAFGESCLQLQVLQFALWLLYSWLLWLLWSGGGKSNWSLDWWRDFIENICLKASKTLFFIRVFEFHYYGGWRSRDGRLCLNGWLYWYGRLYRSKRSWGMQTRALRMLDLESFYAKLVILIKAGGRTTHQCSARERCSRCRGGGDLKSKTFSSTCWACSFSFD